MRLANRASQVDFPQHRERFHRERATPTHHTLRLRGADFPNLAAALDYAAEGLTGCNFYDGRGRLCTALPYAALREEATAIARRLVGLSLERGARVALVADTDPDFVRFFFACQYAGLVPVPLPVSINVGARASYVQHLRRLLASCSAQVAVAPSDIVPYLREAAQGRALRFVGDPAAFAKLSQSSAPLRPSRPTEIAYLQYTSGSTRFPRGVVITQQTVLSNLAGIIKHGVRIGQDDRCMSWLPFYHDMGLVGLVLVPLASQRSVDYVGTRAFAMRPRQWLSLMSRSQATISFSPPFGYELCTRRLRRHEAQGFDLRAWRIAGVGAEMIRPEPLTRFAERLAPAGFDKRAFLACYGMAECSLAVSFAPLGRGVVVESVDAERLADEGQALPAWNEDGGGSRVSHFVDCGAPLPGYNAEIRNSRGEVLPDRHIGTLFVRGESVMTGYFGDLDATREVLTLDGWLNTGDLGYRVGERIIITGREKDLIIMNGRNIWPQDLEELAERLPGARSGDALAFSAPGAAGTEVAVTVVQCRETDPLNRAHLVERLRRQVRERLGIDCVVELAPLHTLPRTSSGKLSRSQARQRFIERTHAAADNEESALTRVPVLAGP